MENKTLYELSQDYSITTLTDEDLFLVETAETTGTITKKDLFKGLITEEQLGDKLDSLANIEEIRNLKFDDANAYLDAETKETVIDFYATGTNGRQKVKTIRFVGGSGEIKPGTLTSTYPENNVVGVKDAIVIPYTFRTSNVGKATLYVSVVCGEKSKEVAYSIEKIGASSVNIGILDKGINFLTMYVVDAMGQMTNEVNFKIVCGALEITSTFDDNQDFGAYSTINIPINVDAIDDSEMTLIANIDGTEYTQIVTYGYNLFAFPADKKTTGVHNVNVKVTTGEYTSNELNFSVIVVDSSSILVSTKEHNITKEEGQNFDIEYRISNSGLTMFKTRVYVNEVLVESNDDVGIGKNKFTCLYENFPRGTYTIKIVALSVDESMRGELTVSVNIKASSFTRIDFVRTDLEALFEMNKNSNSSGSRDTLVSSVTNSKGQKNVMTLHNYNYNTNGWINGRLVSNGTAWAEIDMYPFEDNCTTGFTLDISYSASNMGDDENPVIMCQDNNTGYGVKIDSAKYDIKTESNELSGYYTNDVDTRITFVVHRTSTFLDQWVLDENGVLQLSPTPERKPNPMIQVYIDGILSDVAMLSDSGTGASKVYESIKNGEKILINTNPKKTAYGVSRIKTIAVYKRPLDHEEVLQNLMADIDDLAEQKKKYDKNYVTINQDIPTLYINDTEIGKWADTTKDKKQYLDVVYSSPNAEKFGPSFECVAQTSWQGTSSLAYPVKNIKLKLYDYQTDDQGNPINKNDKDTYVKKKIDMFGARDGDGFKESVFTIKVDYMDSSHCRNTGTARMTSDILFKGNENPAKQKDPLTRDAINGTICQIYINNEWIGLGNFNHDKSCTKSLGLETIENTVRWEIKANTDSTEGAFFKNWVVKGTAASVQEDIDDIYNRIESDFEIVFDEDAYVDNTGEHDLTKYYDELGIYHNGTVIGGYRDYAILSLARYVQFVSDTTDKEEYRRRAPEYFNVDRACRYYLNVMTMGK